MRGADREAAWRAASKRLLVTADETGRAAGVPYLVAAEACRVRDLLTSYGLPIAMLSEIEWEAAWELNRVKSSYKKRQAAIAEWQQRSAQDAAKSSTDEPGGLPRAPR